MPGQVERPMLVGFKLMGKRSAGDYFDRAMYKAYEIFDWAVVVPRVGGGLVALPMLTLLALLTVFAWIFGS